MQSKPGLGRGLGALLSSTPVEGDTLMQIRVDQVEANPNQPRKAFDSTALDELSASIRSSGLIQPVVVRRQGPGFQLIAGERRWRAARQAGLEPDSGDRPRGHRRREPRARARREPAARRSQPDGRGRGLRQASVRSSRGRRRSSPSGSARIAARSPTALRLLRLPLPIQEDLRSGRLTMGHARALLALATPAEQLKLRDEILAHDWSVRATEDSIRATHRGRPAAAQAAPPLGRAGRVEDALQRNLMTRVRIVGSERQGRIEVTYANAEELERIAGLLGARH